MKIAVATLALAVSAGAISIGLLVKSAFEKPLETAELEALAAVRVAQGICNRRYVDTFRGTWLAQRYIAQKQRNSELQDELAARAQKYKGPGEAEQCALLRRFPDLVRQEDL